MNPSKEKKNQKVRELTLKQKRFVSEYLVDHNATQAAKRVGYHPKMAAVLMAKHSIKEAVRKEEERLKEKTELTREYVLSGLMANAERAMQYREVLDREGRPTGEFVYEGNVANRSYELLGKALGIFVDRQKIEYDEATLSALLNSMPPELADAMRRELALALSRKRG